jgi:hypothetical protein
MSARIPLSWLLLLAILAVFIFFGYHILQASTANEKFPPYSQRDEAETERQFEVAKMPPAAGGPDVPGDIDGGHSEESPAPVVNRIPPHAMPRVPGQTEEDLRTPEPLQRTPPTTEYEIPSHRDPLNPTVNAEAEFGTNFRHPEQMIEERPGASMGYVPPSGLGSERSSPGGNDANGYAPEMLQNGAQWMGGVTAFDSTEEGTAYSLI